MQMNESQTEYIDAKTGDVYVSHVNQGRCYYSDKTCAFFDNFYNLQCESAVCMPWKRKDGLHVIWIKQTEGI